MTSLQMKKEFDKVADRNKGIIMVEKDFRFPGGYYVRRKDTRPSFYLCCSQHDIFCMIENGLAALGENVGPILVTNQAEKEILERVKPVLFERLECLPDWLTESRVFLSHQVPPDQAAAGAAKIVSRIIWDAVKNIKINERLRTYASQPL